MTKIYFVVVLIAAAIASYAKPTKANDTGYFEGKLVVEALIGGRDLRLVEPLSFVDGKGVRWDVPVGSMTDGASVPRAAWSLFPPFSGRYRIAAVIHDRFCQTRERDWEDVHRMFFDAMIVAGVDRLSANTMYAAVYAFGPRWDNLGNTRGPVKVSELSEHKQEEAYQLIKKWIESENPSVEEISSAIDSSFTRHVGEFKLE